MEKRLQEILARVFNLESTDSISPSASLIKDLGADSLDFVEIIHLIERNFGVVIKTGEIILGGTGLSEDRLFVDGCLTANGAEALKSAFPSRISLFREGMTKIDFFSLLTVGDLTAIIRSKMAAGGADA